jgi:DNA repair protein RadD
MEARWYQTEARDSVFHYFSAKTGNPIVAMPTGTGKSFVIGDLLKIIFAYPNQRVMMLTHVKELIEQNFKTLLRIWPTAPAGIYSSGLNKKEYKNAITYAGIGSVYRKAALFGKIDLILIDECHMVSPKESTLYAKFIDELKKVNPALKVVGFSATPYRLGTGKLTESGIFTDICYDLTSFKNFNRLVEEGFIAPLVTKRTNMEYDTEAVKVRGGEFTQHDLQEAVDKDHLTDTACKEILEYGSQRKHWLVFASGVAHAEHVVSTMLSLGITAAVVHAGLTDGERSETIAAFKSGRIQCVVNNNVLTTGFDFPGIDLIAVLRPTKSAVLWVQMLGRGTRPSHGKDNCLVLDFAGNTARLGPINDPVLPKAKGAGGGGTAPVKECYTCHCYNHASATVCFNCGTEFPRLAKIQITASSKEVMKTAIALPVVEDFVVDRVTYAPYNRGASGIPTMQVTYFCKFRMFKEWVCLEHTGYARGKAERWWAERSGGLETPATVDLAMTRLPELTRVPKGLKVCTSSKYPEILKALYD